MAPKVFFYASTPCSVSLVSEGTKPSPPGQDRGFEEGVVCSSHLAPMAYVCIYLPTYLPSYWTYLPTYLCKCHTCLTYLFHLSLPNYLSYLFTCLTLYLNISRSPLLRCTKSDGCSLAKDAIDHNFEPLTQLCFLQISRRRTSDLDRFHDFPRSNGKAEKTHTCSLGPRTLSTTVEAGGGGGTL